MERERVGLQINIPVQCVGAVHLAIEVRALLFIGQRTVLSP
jgi:hypothetical protein